MALQTVVCGALSQNLIRNIFQGLIFMVVTTESLWADMCWALWDTHTVKELPWDNAQQVDLSQMVVLTFGSRAELTPCGGCSVSVGKVLSFC